MRPCATPGCPNAIPPGVTRCEDCTRAYDADLRTRRDKVTNRHYNTKGHRGFRRRVLARDPLCVLCGAVATDADHYPLSLRELMDAGLNPNDPSRGRGLCKSCHSRETAEHQPGGWNDR